MVDRARQTLFRASMLATIALLVVAAGCDKNDMAYQASLRPGESASVPPEGTVPTLGLDPELFEEEEIDGLVNPVPVTAASIGAGETLFAHHCAACHGRDGNDDGALTEELGELDPVSEFVGPDVTDGYLYTLIRQGGISMPAYGPDLAVDERWDLVNFIRTFAQDHDE